MGIAIKTVVLRKPLLIDERLYNQLESYSNPVYVGDLVDAILQYALAHPQIVDKALESLRKRKKRRFPRRRF